MNWDKIRGFVISRKETIIHFIPLLFIGVVSFLLFTYLDEHNPLKYFAAAFLFLTLPLPYIFGYIPGLILGGLSSIIFGSLSYSIYQPIALSAMYIPIVYIWLLELWYVSWIFAGVRAKDPVAKKKLRKLITIVAIIVSLFLFLAYLGVFNVGGKPAIYLYPEKDMFVNVSVDAQGFIFKSEPAYNSGWNVFAQKGGLIDGKYDYLYYEVLLIDLIEKPETGWVVDYDNLSSWCDEKLPELGLNDAETMEFKEYWLEMLPESRYYQIGLLSNEFLEKDLRLKVEPKPDTEIRLIFYFKPLDQEIKLSEPKTNKKERIGFTVVEWGGVIDGSTALKSPIIR